MLYLYIYIYMYYIYTYIIHTIILNFNVYIGHICTIVHVCIVHMHTHSTGWELEVEFIFLLGGRFQFPYGFDCARQVGSEATRR